MTAQYTIRDNEPVKYITYYRLRSVDREGKEILSRIVSVKLTNADDLLILLINPVRDQISLAASSRLSGIFNYSIRTINGQLIQEGKMIIRNGGQYTIPLKSIPGTGMYTLEVSNGLQRFSYKIIIQ